MNKYLIALQLSAHGHVVNTNIEIVLAEGRQASADIYIDKHGFKNYKTAVVVLAEVIDGTVNILDRNVTYAQIDSLTKN